MEENNVNVVANEAEVANAANNAANKEAKADKTWRKELRDQYGSWTKRETLSNAQAALIWIDEQLKNRAKEIANLKALRKEKLKELYAELSEEDKAAING